MVVLPLIPYSLSRLRVPPSRTSHVATPVPLPMASGMLMPSVAPDATWKWMILPVEVSPKHAVSSLSVTLPNSLAFTVPGVAGWMTGPPAVLPWPKVSV